jgi:hypothetical protein
MCSCRVETSILKHDSHVPIIYVIGLKNYANSNQVIIFYLFLLLNFNLYYFVRFLLVSAV